MRWLLVTAVLLPLGCTDVTSVPPDRLPPPDREQVDEGALRDPMDPCGALDVEPPVRLSATPGDSDGVRTAVLTRARNEPLIATAWVEHGLLDPLEQLPAVHMQVLLPDGVPRGDVKRAGIVVTRIDVAAVPLLESFVVTADDAAEGAWAMVLTPDDRSSPTPMRLRHITRTTAVGVEDIALVAGVSSDATNARRIGLYAFYADVVAGEAGSPQWLEGRDGEPVTADVVVLATGGGEPWIAWLDGTTLLGAPLVQEGDLTGSVGESVTKEVGPAELRRAQGAPSLTVTVETAGAVAVYRLDAGSWQDVLVQQGVNPDSRGFAVTRGESGSRWALAHPFRPFLESATREIRIDRYSRDGYCPSATACVTVTTDARDSTGPDLVAVDDGYIVVWSDEIAEPPDPSRRQTDVFTAFVRCRPTAAEL